MSSMPLWQVIVFCLVNQLFGVGIALFIVWSVIKGKR